MSEQQTHDSYLEVDAKEGQKVWREHAWPLTHAASDSPFPTLATYGKLKPKGRELRENPDRTEQVV